MNVRMALVHVAVLTFDNKLDRILDGHNVVVALLIDDIDQRGHR